MKLINEANTSHEDEENSDEESSSESGNDDESDSASSEEEVLCFNIRKEESIKRFLELELLNSGSRFFCFLCFIFQFILSQLCITSYMAALMINFVSF